MIKHGFQAEYIILGAPIKSIKNEYFFNNQIK